MKREESYQNLYKVAHESDWKNKVLTKKLRRVEGTEASGHSELNSSEQNCHDEDGKEEGHDVHVVEKEVQKEKKKRRTKNTQDAKSHVCSICKKSYFSYPALYTHKRNKHNIIPITGKEDIFRKVAEKNKRIKFKYSALENDNWNFSELLDYTIKIYSEILLKFFGDEKCILYQKDFSQEDHVGVRILRKMEEKKIEKLMIPNPRTNSCIDEILIIYLLSFIKVTQVQFFIEMVVKFVILLREHVNVVGWDFKRKFFDFGIRVDFNYSGPYTLLNGCDDVPDFINEFVSVFVQMDPAFTFGLQDQLIDLSKKFCNWLFVNNLTSFKICSNELGNSLM